METLKTIGKWVLGLVLLVAFIGALAISGTVVVSAGRSAFLAYQAPKADPAMKVTNQASQVVVDREQLTTDEQAAEVIEEMTRIREQLTTSATLSTTTGITATEVYSYTPGGESYGQVAQDVTLPDGEDEGDCYRVWQATNLVDIPWTFLMCNIKATENMKQQWPHPTEFVVSNGTVEFDLYRDLGAVAQLKSLGIFTEDPYNQALQNGKIGLGWFFSGFNGEVCIDGVCEVVDGGGTLQIDFPRDFGGHYHIELKADEGQIRMWQGARVTTTDNWLLP